MQSPSPTQRALIIAGPSLFPTLSSPIVIVVPVKLWYFFRGADFFVFGTCFWPLFATWQRNLFPVGCNISPLRRSTIGHIRYYYCSEGVCFCDHVCAPRPAWQAAECGQTKEPLGGTVGLYPGTASGFSCPARVFPEQGTARVFVPLPAAGAGTAGGVSPAASICMIISS